MLPDAPEKHPAYFFTLELRTFLIHSAFEKFRIPKWFGFAHHRKP